MTHPDPDYRKIAVLHRFWIRFVGGKISLFASAILIFIAGSELQKRGLLGTLGSYVFIAAAISAMIGVFTWNFWPCRSCSQCGMRMKGRKVRPKNQKDMVMILCCDKCKLFIDLGIHGD